MNSFIDKLKECIQVNEMYTDRLVLRKVTLNDAEDIFESILNNKENLHFLDFPYCDKIQEGLSFVNDLILNYNKLSFCFVVREKRTNEFVGLIQTCEVNLNKKMAEIEYVASDKHKGKGYIPEATRKLIEFLINDCGFYRIEAVCNIENISSSKVMEKCGMKFEGTLRGRAINLDEEGNPGDLKMYSILPSDL